MTFCTTAPVLATLAIMALPIQLYASDYTPVAYQGLAMLLAMLVVAGILGVITTAILAHLAKGEWSCGFCFASSLFWAVILFVLLNLFRR